MTAKEYVKNVPYNKWINICDIPAAIVINVLKEIDEKNNVFFNEDFDQMIKVSNIKKAEIIMLKTKQNIN